MEERKKHTSQCLFDDLENEEFRDFKLCLEINLFQNKNKSENSSFEIRRKMLVTFRTPISLYFASNQDSNIFAFHHQNWFILICSVANSKLTFFFEIKKEETRNNEK